MNRLLGYSLLVVSWASISFIQMRLDALEVWISGYILTCACGMLAGYINKTG